MDIPQAKALTQPRKSRKRVGRGHGSGHGKTCGRGQNGARSRSGWSARGMTGGNLPLFRRLPTVGFTNEPFKKHYSIVNIGQLAVFEPQSHVTPEALEERGLVKQVRRSGIKILGEGEIERSLKVLANAFSRSAREKIEAAGGSVELIPEPKKPVRNKMRAARPNPPTAEA